MLVTCVSWPQTKVCAIFYRCTIHARQLSVGKLQILSFIYIDLINYVQKVIKPINFIKLKISYKACMQGSTRDLLHSYVKCVGLVVMPE